jgi:hypothetical protein
MPLAMVPKGSDKRFLFKGLARAGFENEIQAIIRLDLKQPPRALLRRYMRIEGRIAWKSEDFAQFVRRATYSDSVAGELLERA